MSTITVKQYVMLLTSQSVLSSLRCGSHDVKCNPYLYATPIPHIICVDGTTLSVQAHGGCHVKFADVASTNLYSPKFGKELVMCETDCEDLDQYGIDTIEDIEDYVASHGGIDVEATTKEAVEYTIKRMSMIN